MLKVPQKMAFLVSQKCHFFEELSARFFMLKNTLLYLYKFTTKIMQFYQEMHEL